MASYEIVLYWIRVEILFWIYWVKRLNLKIIICIYDAIKYAIKIILTCPLSFFKTVLSRS